MHRTDTPRAIPLEVVQAVIGIKTVIAAEVEETGAVVASWLCSLR